MTLDTAVLTAAGPDQRDLPLQLLIDDRGASASALSITLGEVAAAEIRRVAIVIHRNDRDRYRTALAGFDVPLSVELIEQREPAGYGDALRSAREFVDGQSFLHLVGDHLFVADHTDDRREGRSCAAQVAAIAREHDCAVSAVQATHESLLTRFGTVGARPVSGRPGLWNVEMVREKPTPTSAELELHVPGLRFGHYLCFFGIHVLPASVFELLDRQPDDSRLELTPALDALAQRERYLAVEIDGARFDIGARWGMLQAQLAMALNGPERAHVLAMMTELLLDSERRAGR